MSLTRWLSNRRREREAIAYENFRWWWLHPFVVRPDGQVSVGDITGDAANITTGTIDASRISAGAHDAV